MDNDLKLAAEIVPGDTLGQIENSLSGYSFGNLQKLLRIFGCSIGDLSCRIAKAKGLKNVDAARSQKSDGD